jgi:hypothetical protein
VTMFHTHILPQMAQSEWHNLGMWCTMWITTNIGIHSREDDPDDHRRAAPEASRQAD